MHLTHNDMQLVIGRIPSDIRTVMIHSPVFVAGGFIRAVIAGEQPNDIDLFGDDAVRLQAIAERLGAARGGTFHKTKNAFTVLSPPRLPVQVITRWLYPMHDAERLLAEFDFTICQAAVWHHAHHGWQSLRSDDFYSDLAARRLVYTFPKREEEEAGSLIRALRFVKRGYNIQPYSLAGVVTRLISIMNTDPRETITAMGERFVAELLMRAMREVDPLTIIDGIEVSEEQL